jgi:hypothetical protein
MSRPTLLVCAAVLVSCAGSHASEEVGAGLDAATGELSDASAYARADALAVDGSDHDAVTPPDATLRTLDSGEVLQPDAAQARHDGGESMHTGACRKGADCPTGTLCRAPDYSDPPCRGMPCLSDQAPRCTRSDDCGSNLRCHVYQDRNCGTMYRACAAPCSTDADCMGTRCQQDGRCLPAQHCSLTETCPADFHCDAMLGSVETGCVRNRCRADTECDGGVCLFELCYASAGVCRAPPMVCLAP